MDRTITANTSATPQQLHDIVADLTTYPAWLGLVMKVEPVDGGNDEPGPAFLVTLRAKVGPFARNKRLRMVRTANEQPRTVRFERFEVDGRNHSSWVMTSEVSAASTGSTVDVRLMYQGQLWDGLLEGVLDNAVRDAVPRLRRYANTD
ncbi:MAG: hypothetical protein ACI8TP_001986 [Acidimicrobiales bacterium]